MKNRKIVAILLTLFAIVCLAITQLQAQPSGLFIFKVKMDVEGISFTGERFNLTDTLVTWGSRNDTIFFTVGNHSEYYARLDPQRYQDGQVMNIEHWAAQQGDKQNQYWMRKDRFNELTIIRMNTIKKKGYIVFINCYKQPSPHYKLLYSNKVD